MGSHITVEDIPQPGPWWIAHEHPERLVDEWVVWSWDCDACMVHLIASATRWTGAATMELDGDFSWTTMGEVLVEARRWREEHGFSPL